STLENLGHWNSAADELEFIVQINERLRDFTEVASSLLRHGIALYRAEQFTRAKNSFEKAQAVSTNQLPRCANLKIQLRIRDYLGLCQLRLKDPRLALKTLQKSSQIAK